MFTRHVYKYFQLIIIDSEFILLDGPFLKY